MIESERLILRGWRDSDREPFAAMSRDPRVMATLGPLMRREESDAAIDRLMRVLAEHGSTFWAIERRSDGAFLGFCGIKPGPEGTPIAGEPEIGWRLAFDHWGQGYAREAAEATLGWAWAATEWAHVAAITTPGNPRSWGLMTRLGMIRAEADDFDHPAVPEGSPLKPHITYRIARP